MESKRSFLDGGNRYMFDDELIGKGFHQLDSLQDAWYYGTWFKPQTLELVEYAEGDVSSIKFDSSEEFIGWVVGRREILGYLHIDDWSQNWAVPIERSELEIYLSYMRDDAIV